MGCHTCYGYFIFFVMLYSYFILVCLWCRRTVGRAVGRSMYGHVITKFFRMGRLLYFLTHGAPLARFARESSAQIVLPRELAVKIKWKTCLLVLLTLIRIANMLSSRAERLNLRIPSWHSSRDLS